MVEGWSATLELLDLGQVRRSGKVRSSNRGLDTHYIAGGA